MAIDQDENYEFMMAKGERCLKTLGRHVISELWECDVETLDDVETIERILTDAALKAGAEIREVAFHKFAPQGVSGVVIISESHLTIHTFPEHTYASIDVYTCGDLNPHIAANYIAESLGAKIRETMEIPRGLGPIKVKKMEEKLQCK